MEVVLITGADGFIGSHLTDFYLKKDMQVIALKKPGTMVKNLKHYVKKNSHIHYDLHKFLNIPTNIENLILLECDLNNGSLLEKILIHFKPEIVLHFGAQSLVLNSWKDPAYTIETNVIGSLNVFEIMKKHKILAKIIVACSSAEYGTTTQLNRPLTEKDPLLAVHPYGISKIAVELLSRQYHLNFGIDSINLRFFNQTGPRKTDDACSDFVRKVAQIELGLVKPILKVGNLNTYRDFTGVNDTVNAVDLAIKKGNAGETYNVCSGRKVQIREVLDTILGFTSKKIKIIEKDPLKMRNVDEDVILGDNTKIMKELGWKISKPLEIVLREMYDYWLEIYQTD